MGGIFKVERLNMKPVYFAFPYGRFFWYFGGPDMRLLIGATLSSPACSTTICAGVTEDIDKVNENYGTCGCLFCDFNIFNFPQPTDYIASTDKNTIINYWRDRIITVGFNYSHNPQMIASCDYFEFSVGGTPPTNPQCSIVVSSSPPPNIGNKICDLIKRPDGSYEIKKDFFNQLTKSTGEVVIVHVQATWFGGYSLDQYASITLSSLATYNSVQSLVRGIIDDYSIDLYETQ